MNKRCAVIRSMTESIPRKRTVSVVLEPGGSSESDRMVRESSASRKPRCLYYLGRNETLAVRETGSTIRRDKYVMSCMWR